MLKILTLVDKKRPFSIFFYLTKEGRLKFFVCCAYCICNQTCVKEDAVFNAIHIYILPDKILSTFYPALVCVCVFSMNLYPIGKLAILFSCSRLRSRSIARITLFLLRYAHTHKPTHTHTQAHTRAQTHTFILCVCKQSTWAFTINRSCFGLTKHAGMLAFSPDLAPCHHVHGEEGI